jgi:hydrogenase maturation factor
LLLRYDRHCRYLDAALLPRGEGEDNGSMSGSVLGSFANMGTVPNDPTAMIGSTVGGDERMVQGIEAAEAIAGKSFRRCS